MYSTYITEKNMICLLVLQAYSYGHSYQCWQRYAGKMAYWATGDNPGPARDTDGLKCLYELHDGRMAYGVIVTVKSSNHGM